MTNDELKARVVDLISNIPDEKLGHFAITIEKVANCYQSPTLRAVLMVQDDVNQTQSIYAINAWKEQASEMLTALADGLRRAEKEENGLLN
ncbi:hypothetical protein [Limnohabitans parvus]|nr:hypothetical protein [Limnohabitans parvus]